MDRAEHGLDHLPGLGVRRDLTTLDRLLDDGTAWYYNLRANPNATIVVDGCTEGPFR